MLVSLSYFHVLHKLKAPAGKFGATAVFKPAFRLTGLRPLFHRRQVVTKISDPSVDCDLGVMCNIPEKCASCYMDQKAKRLNHNLIEHKRTVKNKSEGSELTNHLSSEAIVSLFGKILKCFTEKGTVTNV